jgi:hypothetical protein
MRQSPIGILRCTAFVLFFSIFATSIAYATDIPLTSATAKQKLQKRGVGKTVKVKEADGTELRAKIVSIGVTSVVLQVGSTPTVEVSYDKLTAVNGPGLSKGAKIGIWVGVIVFVALGIASSRV